MTIFLVSSHSLLSLSLLFFFFITYSFSTTTQLSILYGFWAMICQKMTVRLFGLNQTLMDQTTKWTQPTWFSNNEKQNNLSKHEGDSQLVVSIVLDRLMEGRWDGVCILHKLGWVEDFIFFFSFLLFNKNKDLKWYNFSSFCCA